ncbi:MAG: protein translocase subunit SecF [Bdellovibrionales bacterium]|nr:protein translocase subunit SecF [Bdellovibrionales bacterium]
MQIFSKQPNFDFLGNFRIAVFFSILLIVGSFYVWFERGDQKYGVDYSGGTEVVVKFSGSTSSSDIRKALSASAENFGSVVVQAFEATSNEYSIRVGQSEKSAEVRRHIEEALKKQISVDFEVLKTDYVGPTIGKELRKKALIAVIVGLLGILVYISIRFEFAFALGAVVALFHDVIVCTGLYLMTGREISASTLAAALTIVGYSVNDTIIIFDRCREEILKTQKYDLVAIMNKSVNSTLSRTIITSLLTFFSALTLLLFGGGAIADLSLYLVIGIVAGTYSTIFIASPVVVVWEKYMIAKKKKVHGTVKA